MRTEQEIVNLINGLNEEIAKELKEGKQDEATDKAIYVSALKWVLGIQEPSQT